MALKNKKVIDKNASCWQFEQDDAGIAWLCMNCQEDKVNTLSRASLLALKKIIDELDINLPKGLVLYSSKANGFIAGANIEEFTQIKDEVQAHEAIHLVHALFNRIEAMPVPKVALIHGFCLGGGLELALTCDYLIGDDDPSCKLGLPEVKLGIHPGYGGTVRLIERIGVPKAMELMLAGRVIISRSAKKLGVLDQVIPQRYFKTAARDMIKRKPAVKRAHKINRLLNLKPSREALSRVLVKQVAKRAKPEHYPSPFAVIELWRKYGGDRDRMLKEEANSLARLIHSDTARNLVRVFFLQDALKAAGKQSKAEPIKRLHVIGAGVMGGDIAAWSALRGVRVSLEDQNVESIARAMTRAKKLFKKKLKVNRLVQAAMDRLTPDVGGNGVAKADMIIEAIFEDLEAKKQLFSEVEKRALPNAILASNTSSIPIESIAKGLKKPARLVGIHFFNPVVKMQLVEVVKGKKTTKAALSAANAFALQIGRMPVGVLSRPGFLVNRVLMPYLMEAVTLFEQGHNGQKVSAAQLDRAATQFGMPMGPVELADVVGLDICLHVAKNLQDEASISTLLKSKVKKGDLGKKTGKGFYVWKKGLAIKGKIDKQANSAEIDESLAVQMLYPMLNECVACLHEGVVATPDELDAGVIFGTGFAPFRGGPMQFIRDTGIETVLERLKQLNAEQGERFKPSEGWDNLTL